MFSASLSAQKNDSTTLQKQYKVYYSVESALKNSVEVKLLDLRQTNINSVDPRIKEFKNFF